MDVDMPVVNGIDATRAIKGQYPDIVVIGTSVHKSEGNQSAMKEAGALGVLPKQIGRDHLAADAF